MKTFQVGTAVFAELAFIKTLTIEPNGTFTGQVGSFTGWPIILNEEWQPNTWALVKEDGYVIDCGAINV